VRSEGRCPVRRRQTPARFSAAAPSPRRSRNAAPDAGRTSRHRTAGQPRRCGQPGRPGDGAGHRRSGARRSCRASPPRSELRHAVMVPYAGRDIPLVVACLRRGGPDERRTAVGCGLVRRWCGRCGGLAAPAGIPDSGVRLAASAGAPVRRSPCRRSFYERLQAVLRTVGPHRLPDPRARLERQLLFAGAGRR
jgi:hypothetical protein